MQTKIAAGLLAGALVLAGCGASDKNETPLPATATGVCSGEFEGKLVQLEGYVGFPDHIKRDKSGTLILWLLDDPQHDDKALAGLDIPIGTTADHVEMPKDQFANEDMQLRDHSGTLQPYGTRLRITGKVAKPLVPQDWGCRIDHPTFVKA